MICPRCMHRIRLAHKPATRLFSSSFAARFPQPLTASRGPPSGSHEGPPAATSTSAAQPFSVPLSPANPVEQPASSKASKIERPKSSVQAGTPLKGLGYLKNKDPPIALEDHEYPDWLWGLLDERRASAKDAANSEADIYSKTRRERRAAAKAARKAAKDDPSLNDPKVPLEHQTIDLPSGGGTTEGALEALQARDALTLAMRQARRKGIKEGNFLKGMR